MAIAHLEQHPELLAEAADPIVQILGINTAGGGLIQKTRIGVQNSGAECRSYRCASAQ
jgi:hypothetical protein